MMELKKKLEKMLEKHTHKALVSCNETCMCWEIEALLCDLDMKAENLTNKERTRRAKVGTQKVSSKTKKVAKPARG